MSDLLHPIYDQTRAPLLSKSLAIAVDGTAKKLPLTKARYALVDEEDFEILSTYKWSVSGTPDRPYAHNHVLGLLHRAIVAPPGDMEVDHINGNTLDNRRSNLRVCTSSQNKANSRIRSDNTSGFRGVSSYKRGRSWTSGIGFKGKWIFIGRFSDPMDAARAYDIKAREIFGEFARLNFPDDAVRDLDGLRSNLRLRTRSQRAASSKKNAKNSSGFRGVTWDKRKGKWAAQIGFQLRHIFVGYFTEKTDAARAYDAKALELFGSFAQTNFPQKEER